MAKDVIYDKVSFKVDFVKSFATEKECVDHYLQPHHSHFWEGITKKDFIKKIKDVYKICKNE